MQLPWRETNPQPLQTKQESRQSDHAQDERQWLEVRSQLAADHNDLPTQHSEYKEDDAEDNTDQGADGADLAMSRGLDSIGVALSHLNDLPRL